MLESRQAAVSGWHRVGIRQADIVVGLRPRGADQWIPGLLRSQSSRRRSRTYWSFFSSHTMPQSHEGFFSPRSDNGTLNPISHALRERSEQSTYKKYNSIEKNVSN